MKECAGCDTEKPLSHFPARNDTDDGHSKRCVTCLKSARRSRPLVYKNRPFRHRR